VSPFSKSQSHSGIKGIPMSPPGMRDPDRGDQAPPCGGLPKVSPSPFRIDRIFIEWDSGRSCHFGSGWPGSMILLNVRPQVLQATRPSRPTRGLQNQKSSNMIGHLTLTQRHTESIGYPLVLCPEGSCRSPLSGTLPEGMCHVVDNEMYWYSLPAAIAELNR
jgi:hypothetical protein